MPNLKKWVNLSFLFCGIVTWIFLREIFEVVFSAVGFVQPGWLLAPSDIAGVAAGLAVFVFFVKWPRANGYLESVLVELSKVTWPARKETIISTGVVAVLAAIATVCVLFFDTVWAWIARSILY
ncbi:MAG: preprotein translocase subunit SecE [Deltaproteobacteria bacterium]|nr:preprotein translocase subunit SecE [Deltaproteobacteria bacterium]